MSAYKKLLIGISWSPDRSYLILFNNSSENYDFLISNRNNYETPKLGSTNGINLIYNFSKTIGLGSGILISNQGYQSNTMGLLTFGDLIDPRRGSGLFESSNTLPERVSIIDNLYYLDLPLKLNLTFGSKGFRFITALGITSNFLLRNSQTIKISYTDGTKEKSTKTSLESYRQVNISPMLSIGVEKKIKERHFIRIEPTFRYGLLKIIDTPVSARLWSLGLNLSYYFGLK